MTVRELMAHLMDLPDPDAEVLIGEGIDPLLWLRITGIVERRVNSSADNPDFVVPGGDRAYEIV
ncbi:hypothetical protein Q2941_22965 [Bradyrhizobium sp. UFLA05-153]